MSTLHPLSGPPPMDSYDGKLGAPVCHWHVCPSHLTFVLSPCLECV